jgi:hypothetical protein
MRQYLLRLPHNLSRILFGSWLIGMGLQNWLAINNGSLNSGLTVLLGLLLIAAGVCMLFDH